MNRSTSWLPTVAIVVALALVSGFGYWWGTRPKDGAVETVPDAAASTPTAVQSNSPAPPPAPTSAPPSAVSSAAVPEPRHVLAISVDGLCVEAVEQLGAKDAPSLHRLLSEGASTLNARSAYEQNVTLPNHTGMVTGRRIDADAGGHGVTWNFDKPHDTVQDAAGEQVSSIFSDAHEHGQATALFAGKSKFDIFADSWPDDIDKVAIIDDPRKLVDEATSYLPTSQPGITFLHLDPPDAAGHAKGGMSPDYLAAVRLVDDLLGEVLATIDDTAALADSTTVVLTADHGFKSGARDHSVKDPANYTIPFLVWGSGIRRGDLYQRNPDRRDPGTAHPSYDGAQPIRNLDLAAASMEAMGLPLVEAKGARIAW